MIKIMIVDDEPAAGNILKLLIEKHVTHKKEIIYCSSPTKALEQLASFKPTLIMLDIEMPEMNAFDFLNKAGEWNFDVIFTTAYDKYAIKAIRFSALDYLLKPIDVTELQDAIQKHITNKQDHNPHKQKELIGSLMRNLHQQDKGDFQLAISVKEGVFLVELKNIICLQGQNNYTKFFFDNQKPLLVAKTIKEYEEVLNEHHFIRVHKSYLVNSKHVKKIDKEGVLCLKNDMQVAVSRRKKNEIMEMFAG